MSSQQQIPDLAPDKTFVEQIAQSEEVPEALGHFLVFDEQVSAMHPVFNKRLPCRLHGGAFALRDLVLMMRKHQILSAEMKVEARTEQFHAHRTALDMPAGAAFAPWAGPEN